CRSRRSVRGSQQALQQLLAVGVLNPVGERSVPRDRPTRSRHRPLGRAVDGRSCLMAMTGPADLSDVRTGDVLYWREQDALSALFRRLTVTDVETDTVHLVDDLDDPHVFDRATAQVRWPDGLGAQLSRSPGGGGRQRLRRLPGGQATPGRGPRAGADPRLRHWRPGSTGRRGRQARGSDHRMEARTPPGG